MSMRTPDTEVTIALQTANTTGIARAVWARGFQDLLLPTAYGRSFGFVAVNPVVPRQSNRPVSMGLNVTLLETEYKISPLNAQSYFTVS